MSPESDPSAAASENPLAQSLLAAVSAFRVGRAAEGNTALIEFIDLMQAALRGLDDPVVEASFNPHLEEILAAQVRGDVLAVADLLEFELLPMV